MIIINIIFYGYAFISMIFFTLFLVGNFIIYKNKKKLAKINEILKDKIIIENNGKIN